MHEFGMSAFSASFGALHFHTVFFLSEKRGSAKKKKKISSLFIFSLCLHYFNASSGVVFQHSTLDILL